MKRMKNNMVRPFNIFNVKNSLISKQYDCNNKSDKLNNQLKPNLTSVCNDSKNKDNPNVFFMSFPYLLSNNFNCLII